jgi:toxin ParE1/3/4
MVYRVEITTRAESDLADIYERIQAETSPQAATWFNGMARAMIGLERYPKRAPTTPENPGVRHLLYGRKPNVYRIIFKIVEKTCTVHVLHIRGPGRDRMKKQ